jgi:putative phosphoribosyl transferase
MILNAEMKEVMIRLQQIDLPGNLTIPEHSRGIILFSHGSGSSRLSPRNNYVAKQLNKHRFATLLFDLLSKKEDLIYQNRFDIKLLTQRLIEVTNWVLNHHETKSLPIGYFGSSTGAVSALKAAGVLGNRIAAVVSRGGRPDLAGPQELEMVSAPTLLIVGERDEVVIDLNKKAYEQLNCKKSMVLIPGATHLFEEPGTLEKVTEISTAWFENHLK